VFSANGKATSSGHISHSYLEEEADFFRVRNSRFCTQELIDCQQGPPRRSLVELMNSTLVVGQEVSMAVILLAVHREIVTHEESITEKRSSQNALEHLADKSSVAMALVYASMLVIAFYNQRALAADSEGINHAECKEGEKAGHKQTKQKKGHRRKKAIVRLSDGILLAVILRVISGLLRSLTASYSTDTVYALTITGMAVHLSACDYKFANQWL